jgi:transmembrane sensor
VRSEGHIGLNPQINEEAARWFVEFRSGDIDASARQQFDAWMRASPEHLRAFIEIAALWGHSAAADPQRRFSVEALVASAREEGNVVRLEADSNSGERSRPGSPGPSSGFTRPWFHARPSPNRLAGKLPGLRTMAVASVLLMVGSLVTWSLLHGRQTYSTAVGEKRSLRLSDGSTLTLNSRSQARIDFSNLTRTVDLLRGEALFRVAKDPSRPFVVRADGTFVHAVGTEFDIDRRSSGTVVTVVEGRVAVRATSSGAGRGSGTRHGSEAVALPQSRAARPELVPEIGADDAGVDAGADGDDRRPDGTVFLSAGEQIDVAGRSTSPTRTNVSSATAWMQGKVILQSRTLEEVAEDFNRYSERRLVTEDQGEVPLRLSGVFSTDPDFLIRYLRERPDIQVRETATEIRIIRTGSP